MCMCSTPASMRCWMRPWLGEMFDPMLAGYWGHEDLDQAEEVCLAIISAHRDRVEGKAGLLRDPEWAAGRVRGLMAGAGVAG